MQFCTTERPQLFEFDVATSRTCIGYGLERPFWKLPRLMTRLCAKLGSLHADLTPPNLYIFKGKVVPEGWAVTVSRLMLAVIFSIPPFL